ncbi:MAG: L-ribulose-5-phosphate 4-epimerase AraD [Lentisphaerae bacterium]|nr:L-ribulose-5-phosphate 4-epimerase AraD [Lentisphaerota bacterium]
MDYADLRESVFEANRALVREGLVTLTWGNASGADRASGVFAIKPSGVDYEALRPEDIVVLSLETGKPVRGAMKPSSDAATHLHLYRHFASVLGVVHTHSPFATAWAQAGREIPCLGTTHADHFHGPVPVVRALTSAEIRGDYEANTGAAIVESFSARGLDPLARPAALVPGHGPFAWGATVRQAVDNAVALEAVARMAVWTRVIGGDAGPLDPVLLDRHFLRKHGPGATYGQPEGGAR